MIVIPNFLRPNFLEDNSWIIKQKDNDRFIYHFFCSKCGESNKKVIGIYQNKYYSPKNFSCPNCSNEDFLFKIDDSSITINYKIQIKRTINHFLLIVYIYQPFVLNGEILSKRKVLFYYKFYFKNTSNLSESYFINESYLEYLIKNDLTYDFSNSLFKKIKAKYLTNNIYSDEIKDFKILDMQPNSIYDLIKRKINSNKLAYCDDSFNKEEFINYISNYNISDNVKSLIIDIYEDNKDIEIQRITFLVSIISNIFKNENIIIELLNNIDNIHNSIFSVRNHNQKSFLQFINTLFIFYKESEIKELFFNECLDELFWMFYEIGFDNKFDLSNIPCDYNSIVSYLRTKRNVFLTIGERE